MLISPSGKYHEKVIMDEVEKLPIIWWQAEHSINEMSAGLANIQFFINVPKQNSHRKN